MKYISKLYKCDKQSKFFLPPFILNNPTTIYTVNRYKKDVSQGCEEKLWGAQNFLNIETWLPNTYAYMKKVFFFQSPQDQSCCLTSSGQPCLLCTVCCCLVEYHWHTHNVHNTCAILSQHIPFQDTTRKSSEDEPSSATYRSQTCPEIEVHEGIIYACKSTNITSSSDKFCFDILILGNISNSIYSLQSMAKDHP